MPSFDELIKNVPMDDEEEQDTPYLGVPKGYTATRVAPRSLFAGTMTVPMQQRVTPLYFKGDEFAPSTFAREDRARLQLALRDAGLFTKKERFQLGTWDQNTRNAYRRLLEYANGAGLDWQAALREYAESKAQFGDTDPDDGRAPLSVKVSNPLDIRRAADAAARGAIGRKLRPEELDRLVGAYQALEASEQTAAYNVAETGGTMTAAPDPTSYFTQQAEQLDPQGAAQMSALETGNEFFSLLNDSGAA